MFTRAFNDLSFQITNMNYRDLMAHLATEVVGFVDPHVLVLIDGVSDERVVVDVALVRFEAAIAKSDGRQDDNASARGMRAIRGKTQAEEALLNTTRDMLVAAKDALTAYGVVVHGAPSLSAVGASCAKLDNEDALEKKEQRLTKRKLLAPKDGRKDTKGSTIYCYADSHFF